MSDRRCVVYKTPLQRAAETVTILTLALAAASLWQPLVPTVSTSYIILATLILGILTVPAIGSRLARRRGAAVMSREERTRRYLSELGPIGLGGFGPAPVRPRRRTIRR